jgi:hypothetical protein
LFIACFQFYVFSKGKADEKEVKITGSGCITHTASLEDKKHLINEESVIDCRSKKASTVPVPNITAKRLESILTDCNDLNTSKEKSLEAVSFTVSISGGTYIPGKRLSVVLTSNDPTSTFYFTLDGSIPTINSAFREGQTVALNTIATTTTLKVFVRNSAGISSAIRTEVYTFVPQPPFTIYFKKPYNWGTDVKVYYDQGRTVAWPGVTMVHDCEDWYINIHYQRV